MLFDLHTHTSGISWCCRVPAEQVVKIAKESGYDGIVLTNHYTPEYTELVSFDTFIERYIREYYYTKECGDKIGLTVFLGAEISIDREQKNHMLLYGIDENFLRKFKELYYYSAEKLHDVCKDYGVAVIQGHPYRNGATPLSKDVVDGYEINCHPHPAYDGTHSWELPAVTKKAGKILTAGTDFHGGTYRAHGGTYLPDDVKSVKDIAKYLLTTNTIKLRIEEKDAHEFYDKEFER